VIGVLIRKELTVCARDRRALGFVVLVFGLLLVAALDGWNRAADGERNRQAAELADREVWVDQGPNNPHGAAHFSRYAFRPVPALSAFDPGLMDFGGSAVWMEAHYQNPATLRRAEDLAFRASFSSVDPAWSLRVVGSLLLVMLLFGAVAGERESGTLRALAAQGVAPRSLVLGKTSAALLLVVLIGGTGMLLAMLPGLAQGALAVEHARVGLLALCYLAGLGAFALVLVALSGMARSRGMALVLTGVFWIATALLVPTLGGQLAGALHPTPTPRAFNSDIQLQAQTPFWVGQAREPAVTAYAEELAREYGVDTFDDLGFDREAMVLQAHERFSQKVYDSLYGELRDRHLGQDGVLSIASLASPLLALQRVSAGLAGTDLHAQIDFERDSEQHRRVIVELLNRHMMEHAAGAGFAFMADRSLWEQVPDFEATPVPLPQVLASYRWELLVLALWLAAGAWLAACSARRAVMAECQS